jgi:pimeloyl-ACP methyl ester carboxylesterase
MKKTTLLFLLFVSLFTNFVFSQTKIDGNWTGLIKLPVMSMKMNITFSTTDTGISGTIQVPEQTNEIFNLSDIQFNTPSLKFTFKNSKDSKFDAFFDGIVYADSISGSFKQSIYKGTFILTPLTEDLTKNPKDSVKTELPYIEEEISFTNGDNYFSGTLTIPKSGTMHPAVIMITGSGAQNRNEDIMGFKIFGIIADYLTRRGIAVLRYDDRNFGKSKGTDVSMSTTADFAFDVIEAFKFLKNRKDIDGKKIGLFGHSEGGIVAPIVASIKKDVAFIVLMAGTSVRGCDIIREQTKLILKSYNTSDTDINKTMSLQGRLIDSVMSGGDLKALREELIKDYIENDNETPDSLKQKTAEDKADAGIFQLTTPWIKYFLKLNPQEYLEKITCPVLALFGGLDLQVPVQQNEKPMKDALTKVGNKDFTIYTFSKANHLFQTANTGSPAEYGTLEKKFTEGFLEYIGDWIVKRISN